MNKKELLQRNIETVARSLSYINEILDRDFKGFIPLTSENVAQFKSDQERGSDLLMFRYIRVINIFTMKLFPLFLDVALENTDNFSFIDTLNRLEKLRVIENAYEWRDFCDLRNLFAHEYTFDPILQAKRLNQAYQSIPVLTACLDQIKKHLPAIEAQSSKVL